MGRSPGARLWEMLEKRPAPQPHPGSQGTKMESSAGSGIGRCFNMPIRRAGNSYLPQLAIKRSKLPQPLARLWDLRPVPGLADVSTCRFRMSNLRNLRPVSEPALLISSFPETVFVSRTRGPGLVSFPETVLSFPETVVPVPETVLSFPETVWLVPETVLSVPETGGGGASTPDTSTSSPGTGGSCPYRSEGGASK